MRGRRSWRGQEEEVAEAEHTTQIISDDEEDANADLSMAILAKASQRPPLLSGFIVLSDDDQLNAPISVLSSPTELLPPSFPSPSVPELVPQKPLASKKQKSRNKKKKKKASETEAERNQIKGDTLVKIIVDDDEANLEMRQLSRGPRYFDPPDTLCFRCGNSGHFAAECKEDVRKKACFVCGSLDHEVKDCPQSSCLICQGFGHFSRACPNKGIHNYRIQEKGNFCLRCGNVGHEMSTCDREYDPEDLQVIQCYVCKQYGHLCCVDVALTSERQDTCYNCGDVGHTGVGCAKNRGHLEGDRRSGSVCFRCGEEGHFARGCSKRDEDDLWDNFGTPVMVVQPAMNDFQGFRSVPAVLAARRHWQNSDVHERRANTRPVRWPERWNMEESVGWKRGRQDDDEKYNFRRSKFLDDTEAYGNPSDWGHQRPKKHSKHNSKAHGLKEGGKSPSSGGGRRFWRKWQNH